MGGGGGGGKKLTSQFFPQGKNGPAQSFPPPPITIIFGLEKVRITSDLSSKMFHVVSF